MHASPSWPVPSHQPELDDGSWHNLSPHPLLDSLRVRVLVAHYFRMDTRWDGEHRLDPFDRIYHVTGGEAVVVSQGEEFLLRPGISCLIPALTPHHHHCPRSVTMYWTHLVAVTNGERGLFEHAPGIHLQTGFRDRMVDIFERLCSTGSAMTPELVLARMACAIELLTLFANILLTPTDQEHHRFVPVLKAIDETMGGDDLTVRCMAKSVGMSPNHFIKRFTNVFGMTPARYRQRRRLATAQRMLADSDITVDAVARHCGFCDGFHLSKVFRRLLRTTPSAYRDQNRQGIP